MSSVRELEALLFVSDEPVGSVALAQALGTSRQEVDRLCDELASLYEERGAGITLRNVAGGWRLTTHPDAAEAVERYVLASRHTRLTKAALETLAIVAYKQPVTRHQISSCLSASSGGFFPSPSRARMALTTITAPFGSIGGMTLSSGLRGAAHGGPRTTSD